MKILNMFIFLFPFLSMNLSAQQEDIDQLSWSKIASKMNDDWYATNQAVSIAENVVKYQLEIGGWPKNIGFHKPQSEAELLKIQKSGIGATFDNNATTNEMDFLARVYKTHPKDEFRASFLKGFHYIIKAQYENGGWPQFYPVRKGKSVAYSGNITFNDGAYVNVMQLLKRIIESAPLYQPLKLDEATRLEAQRAFDKGIECILNTQIKINGKRTVWCAQHDQYTLAPSKARAYELPSFSGAESVGIVSLLMSLESPSPQVVDAVTSAVNWFEEHKISDMKFERFKNDKGEKDARLVKSEGEQLWARFYDLETGMPFFCDRDGLKRESIMELGLERRGGYSWYTSAPAKIIREYPKWLKRNNIKN